MFLYTGTIFTVFGNKSVHNKSIIIKDVPFGFNWDKTYPSIELNNMENTISPDMTFNEFI